MHAATVLLLFLACAQASHRVVVTFDTWEQAARPDDIANATVVKQYGRRMVIDLGREAELPEAWLLNLLGVNVTVELDSLAMVDPMPLPAASPTMVAMSVETSSNVPWNLADAEPYSIHVENTWKFTNSTPDVFVAVLDTGLAQVARGVFLNLKQREEEVFVFPFLLIISICVVRYLYIIGFALRIRISIPNISSENFI